MSSRIDRFPLIQRSVNKFSFIFPRKFSDQRGGSFMDRSARCVSTLWRNSRSVRDRFETCDVLNGIPQSPGDGATRYSSPSSLRRPHLPVLWFRRAAIVSKHYTHASVNIRACTPAFVVKARWHDAAVIDVRGEVTSRRWLQKLISDVVVGVSNATAIDSE